MELMDIGGGVALILFGIRFLRKGLDRLAGESLHRWIGTMQRRRTAALLTGFVFGTVAPSSTAQTLFALQLLNAGQLAAERLLIFLLGANIGITVTVQLIAFRFFDYYAWFLLLGLIGFQFGRGERLRGVGQTLLGLGFIFLAMNLTTDAARQLAGNSDFQTVLGVVVDHRSVLVLFALVLTVVTQSSTASIGLTLALGEAEAVGLPVVIAVVIGTNLGLGVTSLMAGWSTWEGRRLAAGNLLLRLVVAGVGLAAFEPLLGWVEGMPGSLGRHGADLHTGFNVVTALLGLGVAGVLTRALARWIKPAAEVAASRPDTHLDARALRSPPFALANASREVLRLADEVRGMLGGCWAAYEQRSPEQAREVRKRDDRIDELHGAIKHYLSQIPTEALSPRESELRFGLLYFASQLESVGDIIDKEMCTQVLRHSERPAELCAEDTADLAELRARVDHRLEMAISVLTARDPGLARSFLKEGEELKDWCIEVQKRHYLRLEAADTRQMEASTYYIDLFNSLRRISGHLNSIGHTLLLATAN